MPLHKSCWPYIFSHIIFYRASDHSDNGHTSDQRAGWRQVYGCFSAGYQTAAPAWLLHREHLFVTAGGWHGHAEADDMSEILPGGQE